MTQSLQLYIDNVECVVVDIILYPRQEEGQTTRMNFGLLFAIGKVIVCLQRLVLTCFEICLDTGLKSSPPPHPSPRKSELETLIHNFEANPLNNEISIII